MNRDLKETYDRIAEDWIADHESDTWWIAGADKFVSFLKTGDRVLDVGCAGGRKTDYLTEKGLVATGIDFSEKMIALAKKRFPKLPFFVKDIGQPLGLEEKFDGIFAQAVLLHIRKAEVKNVMARLVDQLKPGGCLYIAVKGLPAGRADEALIDGHEYGYAYQRFFSFYTLAELNGYLTDLNLRVVFNNTSSIGKVEWVEVIAQKTS